MTNVFEAPRIPALAVRGTTDLFPIRRIFCVGRNYAEHAVAMGHNPNKESPFFFTKPADGIMASGATLGFPSAFQELHHEIELLVALSGGGREIKEEDALRLAYGYAVGLDMTRCDLPAVAK